MSWGFGATVSAGGARRGLQLVLGPGIYYEAILLYDI
jgi:hypothetical protein